MDARSADLSLEVLQRVQLSPRTRIYYTLCRLRLGNVTLDGEVFLHARRADLSMAGHLSSWPKICRKNRNTFRMSRKIDAASSGAEAASVLARARWKSNSVNPAKIIRPRTE